MTELRRFLFKWINVKQADDFSLMDSIFRTCQKMSNSYGSFISKILTMSQGKNDKKIGFLAKVADVMLKLS